MEEKKKEIRNVSYRVKADKESRTIEGYAALFNVASDGLWFGTEIIEKNAFDGVLEKSDVFALLNHDLRRGILARWKMKEISLRLTIDEIGLKYSFEAPQTALGDELLENIRRGEIYESSFAFTVEDDTWEKVGEDMWKRTIHKIGELFDVSPVYSAAYSSTSVYMRGKEQTDAIIEEQRKRIADEEKRINEALNSYWETIEKQFNI
ncbi:HK97 family phage prohead protease [uncultured Bacteroides sp.]|uniref:HK97 family phage prohead protease n=1 Tax=uncultured Bacteroides sp. TaxID=162156 RepID=UPI002AA68515|nr:HK97 family phage prohead protease [uncultured Bacteroides sp.]